MFSISHPREGTFRLEIHGSPSELDPETARRLRAVLQGLAEPAGKAADGRINRQAPTPRRPARQPAEREPAG